MKRYFIFIVIIFILCIVLVSCSKVELKNEIEYEIISSDKFSYDREDHNIVQIEIRNENDVVSNVKLIGVNFSSNDESSRLFTDHEYCYGSDMFSNYDEIEIGAYSYVRFNLCSDEFVKDLILRLTVIENRIEKEIII
jgi:hypothetical protein